MHYRSNETVCGGRSFICDQANDSKCQRERKKDHPGSFSIDLAGGQYACVCRVRLFQKGPTRSVSPTDEGKEAAFRRKLFLSGRFQFSSHRCRLILNNTNSSGSSTIPTGNFQLRLCTHAKCKRSTCFNPKATPERSTNEFWELKAFVFKHVRIKGQPRRRKGRGGP